MDDPEKRLQRYRPAGPPSGLRERILGTVGRPVLHQACRDPLAGRMTSKGSRLRDWLPPLIAAVAVVVFYALAANERAQVAARTAAELHAREAMVNDLSSALGGDDLARAEAERLMQLNEEAARVEAGWSPASGAGVSAYD